MFVQNMPSLAVAMVVAFWFNPILLKIKIDFIFYVFFPSNHHSNSQTRHILYKHIMIILNEI